jgi:hypothetical protein
MKLIRISALCFAAGLLLVPSAAVRAAAPAYTNDFEAAAVDAVPEGMMVLAGLFAVKQSPEGKYLELPGEPLDTFGVLFGPAAKGGQSAARFFGSKQGRKFPSFGVSLGGVGGYRLAVSPAKKALEIYKGDDLKGTAPFEWKSETWTTLRLQVRPGPKGWSVEGKAWSSDAAEPASWLIAIEEQEEPTSGRAGIWGSPYSGTPIRFDDLAAVPPPAS